MRRKKTDKKKLIDKLDKWWSDRVKEDAKQTCERCGCTGKRLNSHHIYSRRYKAIRWETKNGVCLCVGCHFWIHQNIIEGADWIKEKYSDDILSELQIRKSNKIKTAPVFLEALLEDLTNDSSSR